MIASLSPKDQKVQNNDRCIGQEDPDCFFMPKYFSKINGGIVTPPLDAPIQ